MKKLMLLTAAVTLGLLGLGARNVQAASANTNAMLVSFQITALIQQTAIVTNNGVVTSTFTTTPVKLGNQSILNMLEAEFATTFPAGAQLGFNLTGTPGFHVLDQTGNPILNVSTNPLNSSYQFTLSNSVAGAGVPVLQSGKTVFNTVTSDHADSETQIAPDYGIYYHDSHGNNFHLDGLLTVKVNLSITAGTLTYNTVSFTIVGTGGGTFFNPSDGLLDTGAFTKVKFTAKGRNIVQ